MLSENLLNLRSNRKSRVVFVILNKQLFLRMRALILKDGHCLYLIRSIFPIYFQFCHIQSLKNGWNMMLCRIE